MCPELTLDLVDLVVDMGEHVLELSTAFGMPAPSCWPEGWHGQSAGEQMWKGSYACGAWGDLASLRRKIEAMRMRLAQGKSSVAVAPGGMLEVPGTREAISVCIDRRNSSMAEAGLWVDHAPLRSSSDETPE